VFTGAARRRRDGGGGSSAVTCDEPEVGGEALSLELVVGDELDVESIGGRRERLIVDVGAELTQARRHRVSTVVHRDVVATAATYVHVIQLSTVVKVSVN